MKRKTPSGQGGKVRSWIRNIKIQYRLLAVVSADLPAPHRLHRHLRLSCVHPIINNKISESVLQTMRSINTNMTIELEKYQDYCSTLSIATLCRTVCSRR